jgi:hypothetical protein
MGGEDAVGAAAVNPSIRAVVAKGATHRTAAEKAGYLPDGITGTIQRGIDKLTYRVVALFSSAPEPRTLHSAITRAPRTPFLLIAGGNAIDEPEAVTADERPRRRRHQGAGRPPEDVGLQLDDRRGLVLGHHLGKDSLTRNQPPTASATGQASPATDGSLHRGRRARAHVLPPKRVRERHEGTDRASGDRGRAAS